MNNNNNKPEIILLTGNSSTDWTRANAPSLGLARIAHELRQAGFSVMCLYRVEFLTKQELFCLLQTNITDRTLFIGINNFFWAYPQERGMSFHCPFDQVKKGAGKVWPMLPYQDCTNEEFKHFVKSCNMNTKLVLGGPKASDTPLNKGYDYVVTGYAEVSVLALARHLKEKIPLEFSYRSLNGFTIVANDKAETFDLVNSITHIEPKDCIVSNETLMMEISRGCIFSCAFCGFPLNGKKKMDYLRGSEQIYREMIYNYENFNTTRYVFADDTFNDSEEKIAMMLSLSKRLPFDLNYWGYIRLDLLNAKPHLVQPLFDSGLRAMFCGIESWNPATGRIIGKSADAHKHIKAVKHLRSVGGSDLDITGSFIVGLPEETVQSQLRTFELMDHPDFDVDNIVVHRLWLSNPKFVNPLFQSKIARDYKSYGYEITEALDEFLIWKNPHMDWHQAGDLVKHAEEKVGRTPNTGLNEMLWHSGISLWSSEQDKTTALSNQSYFQYHIMSNRQKYARELRRLIKHHWDLDGSALAPVWHYSELLAAWQEFYAQIRDPAWPDCQFPEQIPDLPEAILAEIATTHVKPNSIAGYLFKHHAQRPG